MVVAERVRGTVEASVFPGLPAQTRVTVSIGAAQHVAPDGIERTLQRVDHALYESTGQGRKRTRASTASVAC